MVKWLLERITKDLFFAAADRRNFGWNLLHCWRPPRSLWRLYQLQLGKRDWSIGQWISESRRSLYSIVSLSIKIKDDINFKVSIWPFHAFSYLSRNITLCLKITKICLIFLFLKVLLFSSFEFLNFGANNDDFHSM